MSSSEHFSDPVAGPPSKDAHAVAEVFDAGLMSPSTPKVSRPTSAARTLELAALTAEQLLTDARCEAASLVSAARAIADGIAETSRKEVAEVEAQLARTKADLEAEIASLRRMGADQCSEMRRVLSEQLAAIDSARFEPPAVAAEQSRGVASPTTPAAATPGWRDRRSRTSSAAPLSPTASLADEH